MLANTGTIVGSVIGGVLGLSVLTGIGFGFWRYSRNKNSRESEQFADLVRDALNLKDIDNFDSEVGQKYVTVIRGLQSALGAAGIDINTMRQQELLILADDIANVVRNKISYATDCLGRSVITVDDLDNSLQSIVIEVQILRASGGLNIR